VRAIFVFILSCSVRLSASLMGAPPEQPDIERLLTLTGSAASQPMQSPVLGFVASSRTLVPRGHGRSGETDSNPSVTVRAILGVPGAATFSGALTLPRGVTGAYFAPGQSFALVEQATGGLAVLQFSGTLAGPLQPIPGSISRPDIVSFSPNASAAAVFSAEEGRLILITGLPVAPHVSRDVSANLPAGIQALAIADDGVTVLASTSDGRVCLLPVDGASETVYRGGQLSGLVFAPASTNALVFDSDRSKVLLLQNVSTTPATLLLSEGLPEVSGDALLQFDTSTAWVGAVGGKQLSRIDLQTLQVDTIALSAGLAMLQPLLLPHRFLLSAQPGQAAWVLDSGAAAYNVYFVPPQLAMGLR